MLKRKKVIVLSFIIIFIVGSLIVFTVNKSKVNSGNNKKWTLYWSDEFNGVKGSAVDSSKWVQETGGNGWGNNEEQYYTEGTNNSYIEDNNLVIEAKKETRENSKYTSARLITKGKFDFKFGKIEMRAKLPYGQGIWPAFWMLGSNIDSVKWPECGEIDIMENVGKEPKTVYGTLHGPGYSGNLGIGNSYKISEDFSKDYHVYSVEWKEDNIKWYLDGNLYHTMTPDNTIGNKWVFNKDFFLLLNLAVGGNWPGYPDDTTVFPQKYYVDYVRVYR